MSPGPPTLRTTTALVAGIVQIQPGFDVTPFIYFANNITTQVCTYPQPWQSSREFFAYTDGFINSQMELIERWLSAHYYAGYDNQLVAAKAGTAAVRFQQKIDYDLRNTEYGQAAMIFDFQGNLASWNNTAKVKKRVKVGIWATKTRWFPGDVDFGGLWADLTVEQ
jgi:hypothetical protein